MNNLGLDNPKEIIFGILAGRDAEKRELIAKQIIIKLQTLLRSESELSQVLEDLEIISSLRGKGIEKFITKQKESMPIVIDIRKTLRYKEAKAEGKAEGKEIATKERNIAVVMNLLQHTSHSIEEIAKFVTVPVEFVLKIKNDIDKKRK